MAADVSKQLERAKKFLEKNRVEDAIEAYLAVLDGSPQHMEASQALGDLYTRLDQPDRADPVGYTNPQGLAKPPCVAESHPAPRDTPRSRPQRGSSREISSPAPVVC